MIGEGRDGGNNGEYSAIYYKKNKLKLLKSETFWLSETPKKPSAGWDAALNRIVTYGVFSTVNSNKKIVVYNTHFDHMGKQARENSAKLILHHIKANNFSKEQLVVMGDLNAAPKEAPIKLLSNHLEDAFTTSLLKKPLGTFNAFNIHSKLVKRIDYIFTKNLAVVEHRHIQKKLPNGLWPSDHLPVLIDINE
jgi:endonuclease/exonuclease/phosphatase family metal-dependent hydrolase